MDASVTVVIRTYNEGSTLGQVLSALAKQSRPISETIVIDSGSTDDTVAIARSHGVRLLSIPHSEFNFGGTLNLGLQQARTEFAAILSGHAVPVNDQWLHALLEAIETPVDGRKTVGVFGRQIAFPAHGPLVVREYAEAYPNKSYAVTMDRLSFSNANSLIRLEAWRRIPFRRVCSEDVIWAWEQIRFGRGIRYCPGGAVYHSHPPEIAAGFRRRYREQYAMVLAGIRAPISFIRCMSSTLGEIRRDIIFVLGSHHSLSVSIRALLRMPWYRLAQQLGAYLAGRKAASDAKSHALGGG